MTATFSRTGTLLLDLTGELFLVVDYVTLKQWEADRDRGWCLLLCLDAAQSGTFWMSCSSMSRRFSVFDGL